MRIPPWTPWVLASLAATAVGAAVALPALAIPVLACLALVLATPLLLRLVRGAAWSLPVLAGLAVLLADVGGRSIAPGAFRYVTTVVVLATVVLVGVSGDRAGRAVRATAIALFAYGLLGTLYGRFALGTVNGALPLIGPMLIACLPGVRNWSSEHDWRLGLRVLGAACTAFALGSALSRFGVLPASQIDVLNHEKAFLAVLGVAAAVAARDRLLLLAAAGAAILAFLAYPAATYVVAVVVALGTVGLCLWLPGPRTRVVLAAITIVGAVLAVLNIHRLIALSSDYFELVGKIDNGSTRAALYRAALSRLENPLFSQFFTGDITVVGELSGESRVVPVHNDYLSLTLGGGLVAAVLLMALFLFVNGLALRTLGRSRSTGRRRTVIALLAAVNAAAVSAFANPIFMNPGASAVTFALLAALVAACRSTPERAAEDGGRSARSAASAPASIALQTESVGKTTGAEPRGSGAY